MNLDTAPRRAENVNGQKAAAKLYNDVDYELGMGDPTPHQQAEGELALATLRRRFPGVEQAAHDVTSPPNLSRRGQRGLRGAGSSSRPHSGRRRQPPTTGRSLRPAPTERRTGSNPRPNRSSGAGRQLLDAVPTPSLDFGGGPSGGQLFVEVIGWAMGLSLLYLALTHSNGIANLFTGVTSTARAVISPAVDPLNPHLTPAVVHAQAAKTAGQRRQFQTKVKSITG